MAMESLMRRCFRGNGVIKGESIIYRVRNDTFFFACVLILFTMLGVKFTQYFLAMRQRPDRAGIRIEWIQSVVEHPEKEVVQQDGRICRWACIPEMDKRVLRVILLADGETVHNALFDRSYKP